MATICPSFLRGTVMRVTRLNSCGQPVYGDCNQVVSDGFVTATLSAEVEEGEEITVTKANGQLCISERACDQLRWYTTEIEFCSVDPDLIQIMNPTWQPVLDANEDTVGYDAMGNLSCETGFALEIWMNTYQATDACTGEGAEGAWGYILLPWVVGGAPGDLEIGNDAISFTFSGRSKLGSRWRRGPYPVQRDASGNPVPLLRPIDPNTHYRLFVSTVRPPEPECGCQPVDRPVPDPADLIITRVESDGTGRTLRMRVDNHGFGPTVVTWCDGTTQVVQDGSTVTKQFTAAQDGDCLIRVCDQQTPEVCIEKTVTIPLPSDNPIVALDCDPTDASGQTVNAMVTLPPQAAGTFVLDWGDGTATETHTITTGDSLTVSHIYRTQGIFRVTARRSEAESFRGRDEISVPCQTGPEITIAPGTDPETDVLVTVTPQEGVTFTYRFDDGADQPVPSNGQIPNTTLPAGQHTITVCETGTTNCTTETFTIPVDAPDAMVVTAICDDTVTSGLGIIVTVDNAGQGAVSVNAGAGLPPQTNPGDGVTESAFVYPAGTTGTQTISAVDSDDASRTGSTTSPVLPCTVVGPMVITPTCDSADETGLTVLVTVDNEGQGAVTLNAGAGLPTQNNPGDGTTVTTFVYPAGTTGAQTITGVDVDDAARTGSAQSPVLPCVTVPEMQLTVVCNEADVDGLAVDVTVDNAGEGPVTLNAGSGLPAQDNPGDGTTVTTFTYPAGTTGSQTITGVDDDDAARTGSAQTPVLPCVAVPEMQLTVVCNEADVDGLAVDVTVDNAGEGPVTLDAGSGLPTQTNPGDGTTITTFTYPAGTTGAQTITGVDDDDAARTGSAQTPVLPCVAVPEMQLTVVCNEADVDGLAVDVTVDNAGEGPVTLDAGSGLPTQTNPGDGTTITTFTYPAGTTGAQTITGVDDDDAARTGSEDTPVLPCPGPEPLALTHTVDPENPNLVTFNATNAKGATADFDFGDGDTETDVPVTDGEATTTHTYP